MRLLLSLILLAALASPAAAHSLRLFARVLGAEVSGYGFFIGGGRPAGAAWSAEMAGQAIAGGRTDAAGGYAFAAPVKITGPITVTLDTGEGHIARATLIPERFGATPTPAQAAPVPPSKPAAADPAALAAQIEAATERAVERAVAREVAPLLERIEKMDARLRLTDLISGLCLIAGLAGMALWVRGRRR